MRRTSKHQGQKDFLLLLNVKRLRCASQRIPKDIGINSVNTDAAHKSKYVRAGTRVREETNGNGMDKELLQEGNCYQIRTRQLIFSPNEMDSIYLSFGLY